MITVINSIFRTIFYLITGKLKFSNRYLGKTVTMNDGLKFKIFRHIRLNKYKNSNNAIFIVRFKFKKFSHKTNIKTSKIPIPLIAGFKGFKEKIWMIDHDTGYWQGIYQWESIDSITEYKKSFVLRIMNSRSIPRVLSYSIENSNIDDFIKDIITQ